MAPLATLGNARRVGALRRRAFGLCPVPSSPSRPFGVNPSRLRACGAARCACGEGRAPPQGAELVGLRPGLLPQVARKRAVLDAGGSSPVRHEGRFTDTPPGLAMELPRHASSKRPPATSGTLSPCRWALSLPVPGRKPVKPSRGKPCHLFLLRVSFCYISFCIICTFSRIVSACVSRICLNLTITVPFRQLFLFRFLLFCVSF